MRWSKILLMSLALVVMTACADQPLPQKAQRFLDQYFPKCSVVLIETDVEEGVAEYEVWLNDGTKVEFDMWGEWRRVGRNKSGVPVAMIPDGIMQYITTHYPNNVVTKFSRKDYGYKVELSDDMDLRFNEQCQFVEEID